MVERDTGRPRGFGFITFADRRGMDDAIREMHGRELDGQVITVNRAQPKRSGDDSNYGGFNGSREDGRDGQRGGGSFRDSYRGGDNKPLSGNTDCFKCGRPGHFARECPTAGGGAGGGRDRFSRFGGDRFEDRFDGGGRYGDRERVDVRESRYGSRDRYVNNDRYPLPAVGERFGAGDRYLDRETSNGYGKEREYVRDLPRGGGGGDRYGSGGPARYERGSYRERSGPYDRAGRGGGGGGRGGGRPGAYDRY
ncbi:glycine-rich RNA-binding protein RZ1C isoform X2 [Impatiens glandulifera]|nr:glycine-rich RNA-binding protein RZ1C isoform X2 [Impatiens glandulifera]